MISRSGSRVILREPAEEDIAFLHGVRNDVELQYSLMARPSKNSIDDVRSWIGKRENEATTVFYVIADAQSGAARGFIQLVNIDEHNKRAWLGICLSEENRGKSYAVDALTLLEGYSATSLGLHKILLEVLCSNARAIRFYRRYGFREVGKLEGHHSMKGAFHDVLLMEKLLARA